MPDVTPTHIAHLHRQLRGFLLRTMPEESPAAVAAALMYEIASLAASVSDTPVEAQGLVTSLCEAAHEQIATLGVGRPHF